MYHSGVTLLGIFSRGFSDSVKSPVPCLFALFQTIIFGLIVHNKSSKVARAHAHFKPATQAKTFSVFEIVRVHDQTTFRWFGVIPTPYHRW